MSQQPSVLISIPCYNEEQYIAACLDSILAQNYPSSLINVFVVDGMSEDGTRAILSDYASKHEQINFIDNPKKVTPVALNIGLKAKDCDVKIILGAHSKMDKDFVSNSVEILEEKKDVGCVGGIIENIFENKTAEIIGYAMSSSFGVGNAHFRTGIAEGYVDTVAFGAYRKEVFEKIGYFDVDLVRNQDDEFNFRLTEAGFKVFLSKSIRSQYYVRASYQKLRRQYFQYGYWKVFVNKKYNTVTSIRQLVPPIFVSGIISLVLLGMIHALFWQLLLAVLLSYLIGAFIFANKTGAPLNKRGAVMLVFGILHFSYGWGYIIGIIDFLFLNKKPKSSSKEISR